MKPLSVIAFFFILHGTIQSQQMEKFNEPAAIFSVDSLLTDMQKDQKRWSAFLPGVNLLTGLYVLPEGAEDKQQPHDTDEVYYVLDGSAKFKSGLIDRSVQQGDVIFVKAHEEHKFYDIEKDLKLLVFFDQ